MQPGNDYFNSDEFKDALSTYETAEREGLPMFLDPEELTDIADYYATTGNGEKAEKVIGKALEMFPGAASPLAFKAREALERNDIATAQLFASQITDKDEREYFFIKVEILIALDREDEAEDMLKEKFEDIYEEMKEDFILDAACIYIDYGLFDLAKEWLDSSVEKPAPDYDELMARALVGLGRYDEGISLIDKLIDREPYSGNYWNALATAQFLAERYDESIKSCEYALAIDPNDVDGLFTKANCLNRLGDFAEAVKLYERYVGGNGADKELGELNIGTCMVYLGRYDEAVSHLLKALAASAPDSEQLHAIYQELAFAYSAKKCPEKAISYIRKAKEFDNDHTDLDILHGHILLENGQIEEAMQVFNKVIVEDGDDPHTMLRIIVSIYDNRYTDIAYSMFKHLFKYNGDDMDYGFSYMALCCRDMKKDKEFLHYLKLAAERNPKEAKTILGDMFPEGMDPADYYSYLTSRMKK